MKTVIGKSKALKSAYEKISREKLYSPEEAIKLMIETKSVKFDPTAEVHINLGVDPKHADQQVRSTISLPNGTGKLVKIVAICEDDKIKSAKSSGAIEAGDEILIDKIIKGWTNFDVVVCTPSMMKKLAKAAKVLGPKGLMPNPKAGTVVDDIDKTIKELVAGRIEFRNDKDSIIHSIFGKISFGQSKLLENFKAFLQAVKSAKPSGAKGDYINSISINSTMGIGIKISLEN